MFGISLIKISHSPVREINSPVFVGILGMRLLGTLQWTTVWHHSAFCRWGKTSRFWELGGTGCGWQSETFRRGWMSWRPSREPCSTGWTRSFGERRVRLNPASREKPNSTSVPWEWEDDDVIIKFWFCDGTEQRSPQTQSWKDAEAKTASWNGHRISRLAWGLQPCDVLLVLQLLVEKQARRLTALTSEVSARGRLIDERLKHIDHLEKQVSTLSPCSNGLMCNSKL